MVSTCLLFAACGGMEPDISPLDGEGKSEFWWGPQSSETACEKAIQGAQQHIEVSAKIIDEGFAPLPGIMVDFVSNGSRQTSVQVEEGGHIKQMLPQGWYTIKVWYRWGGQIRSKIYSRCIFQEKTVTMELEESLPQQDLGELAIPYEGDPPLLAGIKARRCSANTAAGNGITVDFTVTEDGMHTDARVEMYGPTTRKIYIMDGVGSLNDVTPGWYRVVVKKSFKLNFSVAWECFSDNTSYKVDFN